jgi:UDP-GlcNAc3NAcA epimerase
VELKKLLTIVGARPQFIKAASVSRALGGYHEFGIEESIVHTGQHFDDNMSRVFFDELGIPEPKYNLGISGGSHGKMTGLMLEGIEKVILSEKPDCLLVYGDTNSTLAGALAAAKLHCPVAHVEAGLRSFNMRMPEEVNRILTDKVSDFLFCPTKVAVNNLENEGISKGVVLSGDVMFDAALYYKEIAAKKSNALKDVAVEKGGYVLATCHRAENTDDPCRLLGILSALSDIAENIKVVMPLHPRTRKIISENGLDRYLGRISVHDPLPFLDMIALEESASVIATDSGGVQKEAFFFQVPCITLREETEWVETVEAGWNTIVGASKEKILDAYQNVKKPVGMLESPYGDGQAAQQIIQILKSNI